MQVLYSMSRDTKLPFSIAMQRYRQSVQSSYELYLFNLLLLIQIASYAKKDKQKKSSKLLPSEEDKLFTAKFFTNPLTQSLVKNSELQDLFREKKLPQKINADNIRLIYHNFAKTKAYKEYIKRQDNTEEDHRQILLDLYKHCVNNELFTESIEDHYPFWSDDQSLVMGAIKRSIKALPNDGPFFQEHRPPTETTVDFGETLLHFVHDNDNNLLNLIKPTLKNWDVDRVAIIDMILLKMALAELTNFPTIPTKVTLNEFVDISKQYSTDKSKDFINGILDRLMKKLNQEGKIVKEGRGLAE